MQSNGRQTADWLLQLNTVASRLRPLPTENCSTLGPESFSAKWMENGGGESENKESARSSVRVCVSVCQSINYFSDKLPLFSHTCIGATLAVAPTRPLFCLNLPLLGQCAEPVSASSQ